MGDAMGQCLKSEAENPQVALLFIDSLACKLCN
jgi:hypothetical protein